MIFSAQQIFSDDQAITATAISTNVIDLGVAGTPYGAAAALNQDVGKGNPIPLLIQVTADLSNAADDGTVTFTVECDSTANLATSPTVLYSSGVIAEADLVAGYQIPVQVLPNECTARYLGIRYTVGGTGNLNAGTVTAGIVMGVQTNVTGA